MKQLNFYGDVCIIRSPSNLYYFTGYESGDAIIAYTENEAYYFTDARYFEEVKSLEGSFIIKNIREFEQFLRDGKFCCASVESSLGVAEYLRLKASGIEEIRFIDEEVTKLRAVKTEKELQLMQKAQEITDKAFEKIFCHVREGVTERELAAKLEMLLYDNGAEDLAFRSIVAFGENTSKPHAHRTDKKLERGMPITLDFGAKYAGYCSDMTRTFFYGEPSYKMKSVYNYVSRAQELSLNSIKTGMSGMECDEIARGYFRKNNLDKYFLHSLGHSLGIDIHEAPTFSPKCGEIFRNGMVVSVEPGLYFAGEFGVRIEDVIYFDKNGVINLTKSPKNMIII